MKPSPPSRTAHSDLIEIVVGIAGLALYAPPLIAIGDAFYTLFHQTRDWLKTGKWVPHNLWEAAIYWLGYTEQPHLSWVVPDKILWWTLSSSRWLSMTIIGIALMVLETWLFIVIAKEIELVAESRKAKDTGTK